MIPEPHAATVEHAEGRLAASIFRVSLLLDAVKGTVGPSTIALSKFAAAAFRGSRPTNAEAIDSAMSVIETTYRSEYFYKNLLANRLLFGRHRGANSALLLELKIDSAIIDAVLVNGKTSGFEIKTELDSSSRLASQLDSYFRALPQIVIVTHSSLVERYERILPQSVGLTAFGDRGRLSVVRPPTFSPEFLDARAMMNSLRKEEYTRIAWRWLGEKPSAPSAKYYEYCLEVLRSMPIAELQKAHENELRTRGLRFARDVHNPQLAPIRSLCVQMNPTRDQIARILSWLDEVVR